MKNNVGLIILGLIIILIAIFILNRVDYENDPMNCGAENNLCPEGDICYEAVCVSK